MVKCTR